MKSSAKSLKNIQTDVSTKQEVKPKSLADKLLDTLRYLLIEKKLKINEPGAIAYTSDKYVYLVSKVIMDTIRETLVKDKQQGIPYDNPRLMDEMMQFGIIVANTDNKAIWNIRISGGGFKKEVQLTMLKVMLDKIYYDKAPKPFTGTIIEVKKQGTQEEDNKQPATEIQDSELPTHGRADGLGFGLRRMCIANNV